MYTLTRGRTKVITQSRRDAFQPTIDILEKRDQKVQKRDSNSDDSASSDGPPPLTSPRLVFNGKKHRMNYTMTQCQEPLTPAHEENIKYLSQGWNQVERELTNASKKGEAGPVYYREKTPNPNLAHFEPFDLENWWGQKTYQKLTQST